MEVNPTKGINNQIKFKQQLQRRVYQVDEEEQTDSVMFLAKQVIFSSPGERSSIIVDTGSTYNLIGEHLALTHRMENAGDKLQLVNCTKVFWFRGHKNTISNTKVLVPIKTGWEDTENRSIDHNFPIFFFSLEVKPLGNWRQR